MRDIVAEVRDEIKTRCKVKKIKITELYFDGKTQIIFMATFRIKKCLIEAVIENEKIHR